MHNNLNTFKKWELKYNIALKWELRKPSLKKVRVRTWCFVKYTIIDFVLRMGIYLVT